MFITRNMRLALLISFIWHLFWFSFVSIVFLPHGFKLRECSSVRFLGAILQEQALVAPIPNTEKNQFVNLFPFEKDIFVQDYFTQLLSGSEEFRQRPQITLPVEKQTLSADDFIEVDVRRTYLGITQTALGGPKENVSPPTDLTSASFPSSREIIFQPAFLLYPEWASSQEFKLRIIVFKIYISADGLVEQIINVQASGNPELDTTLARYIRRLRFAPSCERKAQWQTVKIDLDLAGAAQVSINPQPFALAGDSVASSNYFNP